MKFELLNSHDINFLANAFLYYGNGGGKNFYVRHGSYERILHIDEIPKILHLQNLGAVHFDEFEKKRFTPNPDEYEFMRMEDFMKKANPIMILQACVDYQFNSLDYYDTLGPSALMIINKIMQGVINQLS